MDSPPTSPTDDDSIEWCDPSPSAIPVDAASLLHPASGHNHLPQVAWRRSDLIVGILFLAAWRGLVAVIDLFPDAVPDLAALLIGAALPMLVIGLFPIWAYRRGGGGWPVRWPALSRWVVEFGLAIPVLFLMLAAFALLSLIWQQHVGEPPGMDARMQDVAFSGNPFLLTFLALGACLWAPIAEELFFRGFLQNALARRMPTAVAVILQSAAFALMHHYAGLHLLAISLVGTVFTLHYLWRKTLIATMILHAMFNSLMLLIVALLMFAASQSGVLGVQMDVKSERCRITGVYEGSAADVAGLQGGDFITAVDGQPTADHRALQLALLGKPPGTDVQLTIERDSQTQDVAVTLSPRQEFTTLIRETPDAP